MVPSDSRRFASALGAAFDREARGVPFSEVQQFRALMRAFSSLKSRFHTEEYHGAKHQVYFNGHGAWARNPARCELCDIVIVAYRLKPRPQIRVTFLQAKLSKDRYPTLCAGHPTHAANATFKANLEQWDLLSRRPAILPVPPFKVHPLLLASAHLSSVGSFGVFHRHRLGNPSFFYASADILTITGVSTTRYGRLSSSSSSPRQRAVFGYTEQTFCCCIPMFGEALYGMKIGTPIDLGAQSPLAIWLSQVLRSVRQEVSADSRIVGQLLEILPHEDTIEGNAPLASPSLLLLHAEGSRDT